VEFRPHLYAEEIMRRTLKDNEHGIKVGGRQINNLRYADDTTPLTTTEKSINDMAVKLVSESKTSNMSLNAKKDYGRCKTKHNSKLADRWGTDRASRAVQIPGINENSQR